MMKIKNFHGVIQSNNTVFAGLWRCEIVTGGLIKLFICKPQQIYHDLIIKKNLFKTFIFISLILTLALNNFL